jgi:hypothetical protein
MSVSHGHPCESLPLGLLGDDDIIFLRADLPVREWNACFTHIKDLMKRRVLASSLVNHHDISHPAACGQHFTSAQCTFVGGLPR